MDFELLVSFQCSSDDYDDLPSMTSLWLHVDYFLSYFCSYFPFDRLSRLTTARVLNINKKINFLFQKTDNQENWPRGSDLSGSRRVSSKNIGANRPGFGGSVPCPARIVLFTPAPELVSWDNGVQTSLRAYNHEVCCLYLGHSISIQRKLKRDLFRIARNLVYVWGMVR